MHTSVGAKLLPKETSTELCKSCHSKGQGADTAVVEGVYVDAQDPSHGWGASGGTLLGGGFDKVGDATLTTSRHDVGTTGTPHGTETGALALTCVSCHTPHTGPNYRLLRRQPPGTTGDIAVTWNGPWTDDSQTATGGEYLAYTEKDFDLGTAGVQQYTKNYKAGIAAFCTACHSRYLTAVDPTAYNPGDTYGSRPRYRHGVDLPITAGYTGVNGRYYDGVNINLNVSLPLEDIGADGRSSDDHLTCLSCHRGHGTDAQMAGVYTKLSGTERGGLPSGEDSILLRQNDRDMCVACHKM